MEEGEEREGQIRISGWRRNGGKQKTKVINGRYTKKE